MKPDVVTRRDLLVAGISGAFVGLAGCTGDPVLAGGDGDGEPGTVDYPVVNNGGDDPTENLMIDLTVVDGSGEPVGETKVLLQDRGGTPDDREGTTGPEGRIRFVESVGPQPCNRQTVIVPAYDETVSLGCNNGGKRIEKRLVVSDEGEDEEDERNPVDYPVVNNGGDDPTENLIIDLSVVDGSGEPAAETEVLLQDRGGTPDDRKGTTGPRGRMRFVESVGPPPCNSQTVIVPAYDESFSLGCNNGGKRIENRLVVGS